MRRMLLLLPLLALWPARADALTVRDIVELSRAGLGEDVLLALIEVDPSVFPIDAETLKGLKASGVTDRVIVAMVRSARTPPPLLDIAAPAHDPQPAEPQVVVIEHHDPPVVREVQVAYPVYIPVTSHSGSRQHGSGRRNDPVQPEQPAGDHHADGKDRKPAETVYWGSGGKLRPDAWKPK
ncbi:MAG: hypothetical protein ABJC89_21715 [Acidobacteriota bacterium]